MSPRVPRSRSLRARILVLATLPMLALAAGLLVVSHVTTSRALRANVARSLDDAASVFGEMVESQRQSLVSQARIVARDPRFFATFAVPHEERDEEFDLTLQHVADDFLLITDADYLQIFDAEGRAIASAPANGPVTHEGRGELSLARARRGDVSSDAFAVSTAPTLVVDVPVFAGGRQEGMLRVGRWLDARFVREVAQLTGAAVSLHDGRTTLVRDEHEVDLPPEAIPRPAVSASGPVVLGRPVRVDRADSTWLSTQVALPGLDAEAGCFALLRRDLRAELAPLASAERTMALIGLVSLVLTLVTASGIAARVTLPLGRVVDAARRLRAGDYAAPLPVERTDEIGVLARGFDEMRGSLQTYVRHLEDLDKVKSDFLALASHELRTPLTVIISFNDLLQSGAFGDLPADVAETNQIIKDQLSRLNELVQDMLDLVALEQKPEDVLDAIALDLATAAREADLAQAPARESRRVEVTVRAPTDPCWVRADARLLRRSIRALLDNAVRFTDDGGHVELRVENSTERVRLEVRDDGIGIAQEDLRWIFDRFTEAGEIEHHRSGHLEFGSRGFGLGLSIVHATARAHGGEVRVESRPGRGSCFTLELPRAPAPDLRLEAPVEVPLEVS